MLSNKWTFSLTSLVMLLALAFAPAAMANIIKDADGKEVAHVHQGAIPKPELNIIDVSAAAGNQVEVYNAIGAADGPDGSADSLPIADEATDIDTQSEIDTLTAEDQLTDGLGFFIRLREGVASLDGRGANIRNGTGTDGATPVPGTTVASPRIVAASLHITDISVVYYDKQGIGIIPTNIVAGHLINEDTKIEHQNTAFPDGRNFMVTIDSADIPDNAMFMTVVLGAGTFRHSDPADVVAANVGNKVLHWNEVAKVDGNKNGNITDAAADDPPVLRLQLVNQEPGDGANPDVVSIIQVVDTTSRADQGNQAQFGVAAVSGNFQVKVTFTEEPNLTIDANNIKVDALPFNLENAKITAIVKGAPFYLAPPASEGNYGAQVGTEDAITGTVPTPTGRDARYHPYLLTIEPALANGNDVVIRVKSFNDLVLPPNSYVPPNNLASAINRSVLRVPVHPGAVKKADATIISDATKTNREAKRPNEIFISEGLVIPSGGYLVLARGADQAASNVRNVGAAKYKDNDDRARADNLTDIDFKYNVKYGVAFPYPGDNLELFFNQGGTITLRYKDAPDNIKAKNKTTGYHGARKADVEGIADGSLVISEIMWGTDGAANVDSQWIELHNPGTADISIDREEWVLRFDGPTPVIGSHFDTVVDTVGNVPADAAGTEQHWTVPGSNGRSPTQVVQESTLTSMFLKIDGGTVPADGSDPSNWMASLSRPVINLLGNRVGTPGAASGYVAEMETETETETEVVEDPVPVAGATDIVITEIMYSTGRGNLPQWIELANVSTSEASLEGWEVEIDNDGADDLSITLGATTADAGQAVLLVSKNGRNSGTGDEEGDLRRIVNLKDLGVTGTLLGSTGFQVTLTPPAAAGTSVRTAGDIAGAMDWELAAMDGDRSSLIREMNADGTYKDGSMRMSWHLTTGTGRYGTYYGHPSDTGTPGYVMSGPLPVELSMFYPARDKLTGQVVITWETQSELNNAGFYIKRSEQPKGKFMVINPTMIPGAGTTAEKQSYTHTDTTAKPNVLYYYQIEDVSLDGKRATLTGAHRLRGHIGAAGKVTTIWGELKSQE